MCECRYVTKLEKDLLWISFSENVRGRLHVLDTSKDLEQLMQLEARLPLGCPVQSSVAQVRCAHKTFVPTDVQKLVVPLGETAGVQTMAVAIPVACVPLKELRMSAGQCSCWSGETVNGKPKSDKSGRGNVQDDLVFLRHLPHPALNFSRGW